MPYSVTHILIVIIIVEIYRKYFVKNNQNFPRYYILIAALGAILPDIDIGAFYILYFFGYTFDQVHRTYLHSIFIPLIFVLAGLLISWFEIKNSEIRKRHMKIPTILYILGIGMFIHLFLDALFGKVALLTPLITLPFGFSLILLFNEEFRPHILATLDAIFLVFWLFWMQFKLKINDYF